MIVSEVGVGKGVDFAHRGEVSTGRVWYYRATPSSSLSLHVNPTGGCNLKIHPLLEVETSTPPPHLSR